MKNMSEGLFYIILVERKIYIQYVCTCEPWWGFILTVHRIFWGSKKLVFLKSSWESTTLIYMRNQSSAQSCESKNKTTVFLFHDGPAGRLHDVANVRGERLHLKFFQIDLSNHDLQLSVHLQFYSLVTFVE